MKRTHTLSYLITFLLLIPFACFSQQESSGELLRIMQKEMGREMNALSREEFPAYFMVYKVLEQRSITVNASFGSVLTAEIDSVRAFSASVRVGSYELDNTHALPGERFNMSEPVTADLPWSNDEQLLRLEIWNATAKAYQDSKKQYQAVLDAQKDEGFKRDADDFSRAEPMEYVEAPVNTSFDDAMLKEWKERTKEISSLFLEDTSFLAGTVVFAASNGREYMVTSEGQNIAQNKQASTVLVMGLIRTTDNQAVVDMRTFSANSPSELASQEEIKRQVLEMIAILKQLKNSSIADSYSGPAVLSPQAAGVFFHEIFGHRAEGHRLGDNSDSQTFGNKVGKSVLPKYFNITFDPTVTEYNNQHLTGSYKYDDEGVAAQRVRVVESGILRNFLMSRKPVKGFSTSNGHGRSMTGMNAVSRQSNMFVEAEKTFSESDLRKKLIAECRRQKKDYGYYFNQVSGGLTLNSVYMPNVFTVFPTEIYRVYTDGRPDELVRQVSLIGTPLTMFSEIKAAGDKPELFLGFCGAESGSIPVTIVCPSIFVNKIETQKTPEYHLDRMILARPSCETIKAN